MAHVEDYLVVMNEQEQFSVWPCDMEIPPGWMPEGFRGPQADCLSHIDQNWKDIRPLSLREYLVK
jgi:MbtH protein